MDLKALTFIILFFVIVKVCGRYEHQPCPSKRRCLHKWRDRLGMTDYNSNRPYGSALEASNTMTRIVLNLSHCHPLFTRHCPALLRFLSIRVVSQASNLEY